MNLVTALHVDRIGAEGDGVAEGGDGRPVFLALTLPGEHVIPKAPTRRGEGWVADAEVLAPPSPDRIVPPCPHFAPSGGACGGCALQHWRDEPYAVWKSGLVRAALERAGYADPPLAALVRTPPHARRRIDLALRRTSEGLSLGLHRRRSAAIVAIPDCRIIDPALRAILAPMHDVVRRLDAVKRDGTAILNLLDSGPDLLLRTDGVLTTADRTRLAAFAAASGFSRIAWSALGAGAGAIEIACQLRPSRISFAGVSVDAPPGVFLQASPQGEAAIVTAVLACLPERLPPRAHVVELFAGIGTLTHPLAARARVLAYEADLGALSALRRSAPPGRIIATQRDLVRQPLSVKELSGSALVVLDPPYAGAGLQMTNLAASDAPQIAYVSCNPGALAREATLLKAAGYTLERCTPIDQFLWSAQVESVCLFTKAKARKGSGQSCGRTRVACPKTRSHGAV